ncbi:hypothetical protein N0V83_001498 [Neocucurbitaria cava]|uniref:BRCT domain-containing protein n=1 Tax=Neocucurbitaria cava TaxID=798079 RepID=A0A9W8YI02_9PLEO|nr:hypothetical protein N0V83_001498 [Neocucurbitaria cava]
MSWTLLGPPLVGDTSPQPFPLTTDKIAHIVLPVGLDRVGVVGLLLPGLHNELGRVTVGPWGAKLEAIDDTLSILSAQQLVSPNAAAVDPRIEKYVLQPRSETSEVILLRHNDVISFSRSATSLTCQWTASEIQVNSSAADVVVEESVDTNGVAAAPEEETEDEDLDNTVVAGSVQRLSPQPQPTPQLSNQRSVVVQETPTTARYNDLSDQTIAYNDERNLSEPIEKTPSPEFSNHGDIEPLPFSTARTGESQKKLSGVAADPRDELPLQSRPSIDVPAPIVHETSEQSPLQDHSSPRVEIPTKVSRKRSNSATEIDSGMDLALAGRSSKRTKIIVSSDDSQDSRLSSIVVEPRKTVAKGKKRLSDVPEATEAATKSQRSSQRSNTVAEEYKGPVPRVAFSHSAITGNTQAIKFLKKHKGIVVESISDDCNILCVRQGTLTKTMKLLEAIALGIPIVTDKWLLDSAKAGHLLALREHRPSVSKQEEEWNFKLDKVWGTPQAPFEGYTIHFTPELRKSYADFKEIEQVCETVGAKVATKKPSRDEKLVVLAKGDKDKELAKLMQEGFTCYTKDLLTNSILRGQVDLDSDEFMINAGAAVSTATAADNANESKTKRGRKK